MPPAFARRDRATGEIKKMSFGPWIFPVFRILARLRWVRGTPLDPFGYTRERRRERELVDEYKALVSSLLPDLSPTNHATAVAIASIPEHIRGYGHVKAASLVGAHAMQQQLLDAFRGKRAVAPPVDEISYSPVTTM